MNTIFFLNIIKNKFKGNEIFEKIIQHPIFQKSKYIAAYINMPKELPTNKIIHYLLKSGNFLFKKKINILKKIQIKYYISQK